MQLPNRTGKEIEMRSHLPNSVIRLIVTGRRSWLAIALATVQIVYLSSPLYSQTPGVDTIKQVPAPLPKLALDGATGETNGRTTQHKIVLTIINWEKYSAEMFSLPVGRKLPPNPCMEVKTRIAIAVYAEGGDLLANCIPMSKAADLGRFAFLIQKRKPIPQFIYAVINDRYTGAVYRSNLISPRSGTTK